MVFIKKSIVESQLNVVLFTENSDCKCKVVDICPVIDNQCK